MIRVLGVVSTAALVLSACGGGATAPSPAAPAASAGEVTVQGFAFSPASLEVKPGTKVTWSNKDGAAHTTTSGKPGTKDGTWEGQLAGGGSFSFTFDKAGTFAYFCAIHTSMAGTVVVK